MQGVLVGKEDGAVIVFFILMILLIMAGMAAFITILFLAYGEEPTSTRNHKSNK